MLKTLADIAAILIALLTGAGVVAAFQQIAVLRRERQEDRKAAMARIEIEDSREQQRGSLAADGFALPVLTVIIQLQALCLFHLRVLESTKTPVGRFALREVRETVRSIIRELKAYKHAINILFGHFGMSSAVTSTLTRTYRNFHNLSAELEKISKYESTSEIWSMAIEFLDNTAHNLSMLADKVPIDDGARERIRHDEFHFMWLDQFGDLKEGFWGAPAPSQTDPRPYVPSLTILNRRR